MKAKKEKKENSPIKEWEKAKRKERKFPIKEWEKVKKEEEEGKKAPDRGSKERKCLTLGDEKIV